PRLPADALRHFIGPIQSNKAKRVALVSGVVQSVDSLDLAHRLARAAEEAKKKLEVFVEVNLGDEESKAGVAPAAVGAVVEAVRSLPVLELRGLMAIPPRGAGRPHFARLRTLASEHGLTGLSMGMSEDFESAIEEGATVIRVGTSIFGARERVAPESAV